eukprot:4105286-Pyramimonas_sp.AAC.1
MSLSFLERKVLVAGNECFPNGSCGPDGLIKFTKCFAQDIDVRPCIARGGKKIFSNKHVEACRDGGSYS